VTSLRRRALLASDVTGNGGVTTHLCVLARTALKTGWNVEALLDDTSQVDLSAHLLERAGIGVSRTQLYHGFHGPETVAATTSRALAQYEPDVVHVHCGSPRSALTVREVTLSAGLPLVFTEHYVSATQQLPPETLERLRRIYRMARAVISVCEDNRRVLREHFGLWSERHHVIRSGVPLGGERPWQPVRGAALRILCVSRLSARKGIDVLVRAVAQLSPSVREQVRVTVAGDGEEAGALRSLAQELGVADKIDFIGWSSDVPGLLATHDLFVLPSLAEGQPIALLEALSAGLPVIASAVSGIPEALGDGAYGALVPPSAPGSLAAAVASHLQDPGILQRMSRHARTRLREFHDPDLTASAVIDLWDSGRSDP
jgi:glycosyltransferase involved in cell wall biosynthesis